MVAAVALPIVLWGGIGWWYGTWHRPAQTPPASASPVATRPKLYVATAFGDQVQVLDLASGNMLAKIPTGRLPRGLTVDGKLVYVAVSGAQSLAVVDATTDRQAAEQMVGDIPETPSHQRVGMAKVRAANSCAACHAGMVVGSEPGPATLGPDGKLYLAETVGAQLSQLERPGLATRRTIAIAKGAPMAVLIHPQTHDGYVVSRAPGGSRAVPSGLAGVPWLDAPAEGQSWLTVYDPDFQVVRWRLELPGAGAHGAAFSPDGKEVFVSLRGADKLAVVDTARQTVTHTMTTAAGPAGLVALPDGAVAVACFNAHPGVLQVLDAKTGAARRTVQVPDNPVELTRDAATGKLYVAAAGANAVVEVDPTAGAVLRTFKTGAAPVAVAVVP
ncbi:MAG: cell surface protein [Cyanobacteria bacterium RYN_339]|nr:cell surface protein [Cyanobacteria bacterium RYN_339]